MINILKKLLNFIYERSCIVCGKLCGENYLCGECESQIKYYEPKVYEIIDDCKVYVCAKYDDFSKKIIFALKYYGKKQNAEYVAEVLSGYVQKNHLSGKYTVVPVPIHKSRKKERGYNHMDVIADCLARKTGFSVNKHLVERIKDTKKQFSLKFSERIMNIQGAFAVSESVKDKLLKDEKLLIIDDITATGATLTEMIRVLRADGYKDITAMVFSSPEIVKTNY